MISLFTHNISLSIIIIIIIIIVLKKEELYESIVVYD